MLEYARYSHDDIPLSGFEGGEHVPNPSDLEDQAWAEAVHGIDDLDVPAGHDDASGGLDDVLRALGLAGIGGASREDDVARALPGETVGEIPYRTGPPFPSLATVRPSSVSWETVPECELLMHALARRFADSVRPVIVHLYAELHTTMRRENLGRSMTSLPQVEVPSLSAFARQIGR